MHKPENSIYWSDYQKQIADNDYYYARSCIRQNFFPGSEKTFLKIMREVLGKNVFDDANHTTCTGIGYHSDIVPFETIQTVVARHFALMTQAGYRNMAVSCVTSFGIYCEILETWNEFPETLEKTREYLKQATGREFIIPDNVAHTSDIVFKFRETIFSQRKYSLVNKESGEPLKFVEHIGCHYAKMFPHQGIGGAEFPKVLSGLIESWGGKVIDYPERRHCCGFGFRHYVVKSNRGYSISNTKKKLESMEPYKPDAIVANCPGCAMFMDKWQYTLSELEGKSYGENGFGIPVLTYEELAGLVLGYDPWDLGLQLHQVAVEPLLEKMGIHYEQKQKYKGLNNLELNQPEKPRNLKVF
jgi:heterodisulfide reductase subunit B